MVDFQKLTLIIKREFITRVRTKAFIITTILVPVGIFVLLAAPVLFQMMGSDQTFKIAIKDQTNVVLPEMVAQDSVRYFDPGSKSVEALRQQVMQEEIEGFIVIGPSDLNNPKSLEMIYGGSGGITLVSDVEEDLQNALRKVRLERAQASDEVMNILNSSPTLTTRKLTEEGQEKASNTFVFLAIGYIMAFTIYFAIFGYGGYVMRSVAEEKSNRIVEVIVSSVKPFELLLGKILGIGLLGTTQFVVWVTAAAGLLAASGPIAAMFMSSDAAAGAATSPVPEIPDIGISIGLYFILFFVLGYLLYSAILAAVGSAVDSEADTQQQMLPVTIPVILAIIMLPSIATNPDSTFSVVSSIIPFFSPILMVARIPITDVPFWQVGLSILLLISSVIGSLYIGAKIYRTGILSYGSSGSFKELWKWIRA